MPSIQVLVSEIQEADQNVGLVNPGWFRPVWIPKSEVKVEKKDNYYTIEMPVEIAEAKNLFAARGLNAKARLLQNGIIDLRRNV
ncbi:MAG: hypothetical protein HY731_01620 [Candidatus Tectomicrobia bacterium]|nr:hypothetical protein [Candidatus Tectomicrobia bacterium]